MIGEPRFDGVRKSFKWSSRKGRWDTLKGALFHRSLTKKAPALRSEHVALDGIDLNIEPGEVFAVIGPNGAGKSTLLKLASGILKPTVGQVSTEGRLTALIELGAGFHPEITGRENVIINGMLLGLKRSEIIDRLPEIEEFADIGEFIDQPVKIYSSGMYVRLGFAVAVTVDPDIMLIDEVLSVGDEVFSRRCLDRLARMRRSGVTQILVSHDLDLVAEYADRAVYLKEGKIRDLGPADSVVARYRSDAAGEQLSVDENEPVRIIEEGRRWGNGAVEILSVSVMNNQRNTRLVPSGEGCTLVIEYRSNEPVDDFVFGLAWHNAEGVLVGGHNTDLDGLRGGRLDQNGTVRCSYEALNLAPGDYFIDAAVHSVNGLAYDYWCRAARLKVTAEADWPGVWAPQHRWNIENTDETS